MKNKKALIIDAQLFQSLAIHRGMGKYSLALLGELNKQINSYDEKILILNNLGIDSHDLNLVKKLTSNFTIMKLDLKTSTTLNHKNYKQIENKNKKILDAFIEENLKSYDVDFLILSLFQDSECPTFPSNVNRKCLLVYDLIPIQFPEFYLYKPYTTEVHLSRYKVFYEADHFFAISDTVATDITIHLGIPAERITPIYGAQINRKKVITRPYDDLVGKQYVLLPTGDDHRKNNRRAVLAFNEANRKMGYTYKLVLTSFFNDNVQTELLAYCEHLVFTNNVSEAHLSWLYQNTDLVLFPSEYEGLGMPVIEAVEFNKPVVCSNISVFKEISETAFNYCDPYSIESIEYALTRSLLGEWHHDKKEYSKILKKYSWEKTATLMRKSLDVIPQELPTKMPRPKIAIFAPSPEGYSAIGKVVQEQHYVFSRFADIDYYLEEGYSENAKTAHLRKNLLPYVASCQNPWVFNKKLKAKYDFVIYHIGNSEYHASSLIKALSFPSKVILHDTNIEGLYDVVNVRGLTDQSRFDAEKQLNKLMKPSKGNFLVSLVNRQETVFVHSSYAKDAVENAVFAHKNPEVHKLNLSSPSPYHLYNKSAEEEVVIALAGNVHEAKGLSLVERIAALNIQDRSVVVKIFGYSLISEELEEELQAISNVKLIKSLSDLRFTRELVESDIIVNYRPDYYGETSLSTLEALRQGKPAIVNDSGWFKELPSGIVYKVKSKSAVFDTIKRILTLENPEIVQKRLEYMKNNHSIEGYIKRLLQGHE